MRWSVTATVGIACVAAAIIGLSDGRAQQFYADGAAEDPPHAMEAPGGPRRMQGWVHGGGPASWGAAPLGLVFTAPDRQLSQGDVQKIAEAYLLWRGNHEWRVTNLATDGDRVMFSIATAQNAVIASFAMDRHTGALTRTG